MMITVKALTRFVHHHIDAKQGAEIEMSESLAKDLAKAGLVEDPEKKRAAEEAAAAAALAEKEKAAPPPANKKAPDPKNKGA